MAGESGFVSRKEFARLRGCSPPYVTKLGNTGRLVLDSTGKLVDVAATLALLDRVSDPARGGDRSGKAAAPAALPAPQSAPDATSGAGELPPPGMIASPSYKTAATRERLAKARLAELELAEKAGNLVRRDEVEAAVFGLARQAMEALDAIADRLSTQLAAEADPGRVHQLLSNEIRQVKQQLADARPLPALPAQQPEQEAA